MIIRGEKVFLRPINPSDFPKMVQWGNDPEVTKYLEGDYPETMEECSLWHQRSKSDRHSLRLGIVASDDLIGDIELDHIAWRSGDAEMRIRIGDPKQWNQGFGSDAVMALLGHAFTRMNLNRIYLRVISSNQRAIRCYEKCGFRKEGQLRRPGPNGQQALILLMRIKKNEYMKAVERGSLFRSSSQTA